MLDKPIVCCSPQEMGFTKEQSANAMIIHGSVEKALDALSGLHGKKRTHMHRL